MPSDTQRGKFPRHRPGADRTHPDLPVPFIQIKPILHAVITEVQSVLRNLTIVLTSLRLDRESDIKLRDEQL